MHSRFCVSGSRGPCLECLEGGGWGGGGDEGVGGLVWEEGLERRLTTAFALMCELTYFDSMRRCVGSAQKEGGKS